MYLVTALCLLATALAAPLTTYDQRQEGDFNVHAHLENFIIVLIPSGNGGLLDFAKSSPGKLNQIKRLIGGKHVEAVSADVEFIDKQPARNLEPPVEDSSEPKPQVVVAESPSVTLTKEEPTVAKEKTKEEPTVAKEEPTVANEKAKDEPTVANEKTKEEPTVAKEKESSEARARAAKLERLREGLDEGHLHNNRNSKGFPSQELLRSLRFGLSPAN